MISRAIPSVAGQIGGTSDILIEPYEKCYQRRRKFLLPQFFLSDLACFLTS